MKITITNGTRTIERGNTKADREAAAAFICANVRCRYTPDSKKRAKDFARLHRL